MPDLFHRVQLVLGVDPFTKPHLFPCTCHLQIVCQFVLALDRVINIQKKLFFSLSPVFTFLTDRSTLKQDPKDLRKAW